MNTAVNLQLGLDDLLADLRHARRSGDLGRAAFIAYCEVRRWARTAGEMALAEHASEMIIASPHNSRAAFLEHVDTLIDELEQARPRFGGASPARPPGVRPEGAPAAGAPAAHGCG